MTERWIAHLDMDAFYASVELLRYPELRGRPVVVGGRQARAPAGQSVRTTRFAALASYAGRGVVTTATYEARSLGVHSGMGLMKAAALAPDAVLLPADFDEYRKYSRMFKAAVAEVAPRIEDRGIDEIYIDLSDVPGIEQGDLSDPHAGLRAVAQWIKAEVRRATGLSCSIGVTPNKLLSKICSDLDKPDGLTILTLADVPARIWPLPARRINGIGPKASIKLEALGIHTIGDLARAPVDSLVRQFGHHFGSWMHEVAHGRDERGVVTWSEPKSISRETTFERDLRAREDREELGRIFTRLCEQLSADLTRQAYLARTIAVKLRYDDFKIATRALTLEAPVSDARQIRLWAGRCLKKAPLERPLRLLGVRAAGLCREEALPVRGEGGVASDQLVLPI